MKNFQFFFKNFIYTFSSNFFKLLFNVMVILVMPKLIGVTDYSYFQYYTLLSNYTVYFHFGWCDGIYLRYVGINYADYDKKIISNQFWGSCTLGFFLLIIIGLLTYLTPIEMERKCIFICIAFDIAIVTPQIMISVILQASSRLKESSRIILIEKMVYGFELLMMTSIGIRQYEYLILGDVLGKFVSLIWGMNVCKDIIGVRQDIEIKEFIMEMKNNFQVGIFLLIANLSSVLITGIPQFFIEAKWGIETFGYVSFALNLSKIVMIIINAISVILIPFFRNSSDEELISFYPKINTFLITMLFGVLTFYYPLKSILSFWLPEYGMSIKYLALLFPMCLFESKTALLLNTYLKALREERKLCFGNAMAVIISFFISLVNIYLLKNLTITMAFISMFLALRKVILENLIDKRLKIIDWRDSVIEILLSIVFMVVSWNYYKWFSAIIYLCFFLLYIVYKKDIIHLIFISIGNIKSELK